MHLTFHALRQANELRLPQFKNAHGQPAHENPDGSDWTPGQWLGAVVGELGELARVRLNYELGKIDRKAYEESVEKESADVATYLDLFALRSLDTLALGHSFDMRTQHLLEAMACLGEYANAANKFDRGDLSEAQFVCFRGRYLGQLEQCLQSLRMDVRRRHVKMHAMDGFSLGGAISHKFNEVSARVGANVHLIAGNIFTSDIKA